MKLLTAALVAGLALPVAAMAQTESYDPNAQNIARADAQMFSCYSSTAWMALNLPRIKAQAEGRNVEATDFDRAALVQRVVSEPACRADADLLYRQSVPSFGIQGMSAEEAADHERALAGAALDAVLAGYNPIRPGG